MPPTIVTHPPPAGSYHMRGQMSLSAQQATTCTLADTYYKIAGANWEEAIAGANCCFSVAATGRLTYNGPNGAYLIFAGTSDLEVTDPTAHTVTYALYVNGALIPKAQTPHDFNATNKVENISIVNFVQLDNGDYIEVWVKSSAAGDVVTSKTLSIALSGTSGA